VPVHVIRAEVELPCRLFLRQRNSLQSATQVPGFIDAASRLRTISWLSALRADTQTMVVWVSPESGVLQYACFEI
jgi:hypothetical protein